VSYGGGCHGGVIYGGGCHGGVSYSGCGGTIIMGHATAPHSTMPVAEAAPASPGNGARIEVKLPSAGQLTIDNYTVPHTSDRHIYVTAPLNSGEKREITFSSGSASRKVTVTAGQTLQVDLGKPDGVAAR
jgi:hypothetical protein